jgi:hypothetical protein
VYDVKAFGAQGDGITDDSAAVTAAIITAAGQPVYFPQGTYILAPMTLTAAARFRGAGRDLSIIKLKGQAGGVNVAVFTVSADKCSFEDLGFHGNGTTIGSGNYWGGLIQVTGGTDDCTIRRCAFQTTGRTAIYATGSGGTQIYRLRVDDCTFTDIGRSGAANGGACVMLDGGVNDSQITDCYAFGTLTSNFLKVKVNTGVNCLGTYVRGNLLDYSACTTFDATNSALGIELWNGAWNSRVEENIVYGPNTIPVAGEFWAVSFGDARGSVCSENQIIGGTNIQAAAFGIEVGECPSFTMRGNHISNVKTGSNFTNNNPLPSHSIIIEGNTYENCYENGIISDSAPSAFKIIGNTFIDCGVAYIFFNSVNVGGGDGTVKGGIVSSCTFQVKNQTRLHAETAIFGVYVLGADSTKIARVTIADCNFIPYPGGTSTIGMTPVEVNNPRGVKIHHCNFDGARPDTGAAQAVRAINGYCGDLHVDHCTAVNFVTEFAFTSPPAAAPQSTFEFNTLGSLAIVSSANGPNVVMYWSTADGRLHVRNQAGTDAAVGP